MIQDTDEQIESRNMYTISQEYQIDRTVRELMTLYDIYHQGELATQSSGVVSVLFTFRLFSDTSASVESTDCTFVVNFNAEVHRKGSIWDFTDKAKTRACVKHYLRNEIDKNYKKYGELGYLSLKKLRLKYI